MPKDFPRAKPRPGITAGGSPVRPVGEAPSPYSHTEGDDTPSAGGIASIPIPKPTPPKPKPGVPRR